MESLFPNYSYPLNNYNYNYKNYIDKNYNLEAKGISNQPTFGTFRHNVNKLVDYSDALVLKPIPGDGDVAGITDIDPKNPEEVAQAQRGFSQGLPYRKFRQEYPEKYYRTDGKYSSSYFVQSGFCPVQSAKTAGECKAKDPNYIWIDNPVEIPDNIKRFLKNPLNPLTKDDKNGEAKQQSSVAGSCYKPRYSYVNNANENKILAGIIPGIIDDVLDLNPVNFVRTIAGEPIPGSSIDSPPRFELLPCVAETFANKMDSEDKKNISHKNINNMEKREDFYGWWHPYGRWGPWGPWGPRPYRRWWLDRPVRLAYPLGPAAYIAEGFENMGGDINRLLAVIVLIVLTYFMLKRK